MNAIENNWGQQVHFTNLPPPSSLHTYISSLWNTLKRKPQFLAQLSACGIMLNQSLSINLTLFRSTCRCTSPLPSLPKMKLPVGCPIRNHPSLPQNETANRVPNSNHPLPPQNETANRVPNLKPP